MSGGKKAATKTEAQPVAPQYQQVAPFMPGMQNMLAQQLAGGFGGNPQDIMSYMNQLYAPMNMPLQSVIMASGGGVGNTPSKPIEGDDRKRYGMKAKQDAYNGRIA
jgi:hypothetical protein